MVEALKNLPPEEKEKLKKELVLRPLESKEELRAWLHLFFDILFPMGTVYPTSTHGPIDAMWRIYELMKTGESMDIPQVTMLASRDSYKTLSAAALEVLCMIHFRMPIAHMAAIKAQSAKSIQYVNSFFRKLRPYLEHHEWKKSSDSKTYIEWITDKDETVYLNIVTATIAGANSEHVPMLFIDEVDVVQDPRALKEAKMIPSVFKNYFPLTVYLSTRKFAGGLMEKTLKETVEAGGEILRWNILDVAARVSHEEAKVDEPKVERYVSRNLPMQNLTFEEFTKIPEENRHKYERVELYAGTVDHPLAPVMRNYLVDRPQEDVGDLYKPVIAVLNNFKTVSDPDMADAQLLCNKPSSSGLVYPRFDEVANVLSVNQALRKLLGDDCDIDNFEYLKEYINNLGIEVIGGGDWGYTDYTALGVFALIPGGEIILLDTIWLQFLELGDIVKYGSELQNEWNVSKWYVDQAYPAYIKTLKKRQKEDGTGGAGWNVPKFKKVVEDGITALQGKIVDTTNTRKFYVLDTPNNKPVINAFGEYRWALDGKGEIIEGKPYHDKDGAADIMDMIRYPAQNRFMKGKGAVFTVTGEDRDKPSRPKISSVEQREKVVKDANQKIMQDKINELATRKSATKKTKKVGRIFWA